MILGILWMLIANAAVLGVAVWLLRRFRTGSEVDWPLLLVLRIALISAIVLLSGLAGTLTAVFLGIAGGATLALLLATRALRPGPGLPRLEAGPVALAISAIVALRLAWQVAAFSPHVGDTLTYHLPKVAEWVRAGGFTRELGADVRASFPAGFELIEAWWVVFLRHDALIELAGIEFLLLAFAAVHSLGRTLGLAPRTAFWAALLFVLVPSFHLQATSCLNDGAVSALLLTALAFAAARAPLPLVAGVIGLGIGVKPTFAYALPGVAFLAFAVRRAPALSIPAPRGAVLFAIAATLAGASWYLRNLLWYGNPIHPVGLAGIHGPSGSLSQQVGPSLSSFTYNIQCLLDVRLLDSHRPYGPTADAIAGWGPVAVACGLPSLILALREDRLWRLVASAFGISLLSVFALVQLDLWFMRFVLFFPAILALSIARLGGSWKGVVPLCVAGLLLQFAGTFVSWEWRARLVVRPPPELAPREPVACFGDNLGFSYQLYGRDYSRPVLFIRADSAAELVDRVRRSGARILFASPEWRRDKLILVEALRLAPFRDLDRGFFLIPQDPR
ncbi:MAG TPA: hypothetical protein VJB14_07800 [Planctomycetota bacterium]|nr:hypothetical protein [Planctomycetota bacterium]